MFTGLIEAVGEVAALAPMPGGSRLRLRTALAGEVTLGESVAVNGTCLTVTGRDGDTFSADLGPETMRVTALGALQPGARVNLERSMRADGRFGGHFVQGHVDGVGRLTAVRDDGEAHWLTIAYPRDLTAGFVQKGSIAVNGVSLTIADLRDGELDIMIIPFTWTHTALSTLEPGDAVNLEADVIGKYVMRALDVRQSGGSGQEAGQ